MHLAIFAVLLSSCGDELSPREFQVRLEKRVHFRMGDGAELVADIAFLF